MHRPLVNYIAFKKPTSISEYTQEIPLCLSDTGAVYCNKHQKGPGVIHCSTHNYTHTCIDKCRFARATDKGVYVCPYTGREFGNIYVFWDKVQNLDNDTKEDDVDYQHTEDEEAQEEEEEEEVVKMRKTKKQKMDTCDISLSTNLSKIKKNAQKHDTITELRNKGIKLMNLLSQNQFVKHKEHLPFINAVAVFYITLKKLQNKGIGIFQVGTRRFDTILAACISLFSKESGTILIPYISWLSTLIPDELYNIAQIANIVPRTITKTIDEIKRAMTNKFVKFTYVYSSSVTSS